MDFKLRSWSLQPIGVRCYFCYRALWCRIFRSFRAVNFFSYRRHSYHHSSPTWSDLSTSNSYPWWWIGPVLHTKSCILHIICNILYVAKYYMTQRWLWYKFLKHKTLHIVKTYCSFDKIKNHKSSHFSCFKRSIFSFLIIIISSASIETKWSKVHWLVQWSFWASRDFQNFLDWSSEFHLPMNEILSQTDKILLAKGVKGSIRS